MKCDGDFVYKGIEERRGGEFTNDKGEVIKYDPAYKITLDEVNEGKAYTRNFTFPLNNTVLFDKFKNLRLYDDIVVIFDVAVSKKTVKLIPVDVLSETAEL